MLGTRPGAGPSKRETGLELLLLYGDEAVSEWPSEADGADPLALGSDSREPRSDKEARHVSIQVPEPADSTVTSAIGDSEISQDSWLNTSASVSTLSNTRNGETQQDTDMSIASNCIPLVTIDSGSSAQKSTDVTRFTREGHPPEQNLEVPSGTLPSIDDSTFDIPIAGSSSHPPFRSSSYTPSSQIDGDSKLCSQLSDSNQPIDLCLPKIVPREADPVREADSNSSDSFLYDSNLDRHADSAASKNLSDISSESENDDPGSRRPPATHPCPNLSQNCYYQQGVPPTYPPFMAMGAPNIPCHPPGLVMVGENALPVVLVPSVVVPSPAGPLVIPTWQTDISHRGPDTQQDEVPPCEIRDVTDEEELELIRRPKIIELQEDGQVVQNESVHKENNLRKSETHLQDEYHLVQHEPLQKGKNSDNSDAESVVARKEIIDESMDDETSGTEKCNSQDRQYVTQPCTDDPRPGSLGAAGLFQHRPVPSEETQTSTAQSRMQLALWSSPSVRSSSFSTYKPPVECQLPHEQQLNVTENVIQQHTDQPQLAQSPIQVTSPSTQVHISSNHSLTTPASNQPTLMQQTTERLLKPGPAHIQEDTTPSHSSKKFSSNTQLLLPRFLRVEAQTIQLPTTVEQTTVKSEVSTEHPSKSPLKTGPSCTSVSTTVNENVSCNFPSSLSLSIQPLQNSIQIALPVSPSEELPLSTNGPYSDKAENQPVQSTMCAELVLPSMLVVSQNPESTQKFICLEPTVMHPSQTQKASPQEPLDDIAAMQLPSSSTSCSGPSPSQLHSPQPSTTGYQLASSQLLDLPPQENHVQSPPAAVGQDVPLRNTELPVSPPAAVGQESMSLQSPQSPNLKGVAVKSKSIVKRSREPWNHKGLIRFVGCFAFSLPRHIWIRRKEGEPRRSVRIAEKLKAQRYFLRPRTLSKRRTDE